MRALILALLLVTGAGPAQAYDIAPSDPWFKDRLLLGEIQFNAQQGKFLDALIQIDNFQGASIYRMRRAEQKLQSSSAQPMLRASEIELGYRMSQRAGNAVRAVLGDDIDQEQRNRAAYELARIYYDKQQYDFARYALALIRDELFYPFKQEVDYLRAQIAARSGDYDTAVPLLQALKHDQRFSGFATYNLGHILQQQGKTEQARAQLTETGNLETQDRSLLALRDKANLVLGFRLLNEGDAQAAKQMLNKVRLHGAFSNRALLGDGWASMALQDYQAALTPWSELAGREATDESVQEAVLALPYAYGKLGLYQNAIELYQGAIETFDVSLDRLAASLATIESGKFLQLVAQHNDRTDASWLLRLRELPDTPETWYLMDLMASSRFQESMQNYIDMVELRARLASWLGTVAAFQNLVEVREQHFAEIQAGLGGTLDNIDLRLVSGRRQSAQLGEHISAINQENYRDYLLHDDEREMLASLQAIAALADESDMQRVKRARGVIEWKLLSEYASRLDALKADQLVIDEQLQSLSQKRDRVSALQPASRANYRGYEIPLRILKDKIVALNTRLDHTLGEQSQLIESMASEELQRRVEVLQAYQATAKYELAKNYDLATNAIRN